MLYLSWGMKARAIINISCFDQLHVMTTYSQNARKLRLSVFCSNTARLLEVTKSYPPFSETVCDDRTERFKLEAKFVSFATISTINS